MNKEYSQNSNITATIPFSITQAILEELRVLRKEISFVLPQDDLKNYTHPEKIHSAYKKAIKSYPPVSYGNY